MSNAKSKSKHGEVAKETAQPYDRFHPLYIHFVKKMCQLLKGGVSL